MVFPYQQQEFHVSPPLLLLPIMLVIGTNEEISPFAQFLNGDTNDVREITIYGKDNH